MEQMKRLNTLGQTGLLTVSRQAVDRLEALGKKQMDLGLSYLRDELNDVEALFGVTNLDGLAQWNANRAHAAVERVSAAMREQIASTLQAQDDITRSIQEQFAALSREASALIEGLGSQLPNNVQPFTEAMGAVAAATNEAIENIARMSTKLGDEFTLAIARAADAVPQPAREASRAAA